VTAVAPGRDPDPKWALRFGLLTDPGLARERNEDACAVYVPWHGETAPARADALFLVADGMGGHEAGDVASAHVAATLRRWFTTRDAPEGEDDDAFGEALQSAVLEIHDSLLALGRERGLARGAGSTLTALCLRGDQAHVAHVGDSRLYRLRDDALARLTRDHAWVAEQLRAGVLSPEEAALHPQRHMLTQCLGVGGDIQVDLFRFQVLPGDRFLLCSDGLHGPVTADEIRQVMAASSDPQRTARALVDRANQATGPDNITAVVLHLDLPWQGPTTEPELALPGIAPAARGSLTVHGASTSPTGKPPRLSSPPPLPWGDGRGGTLRGFLAGAGAMLLLVALIATLVGEDDDHTGPPPRSSEVEDSATGVGGGPAAVEGEPVPAEEPPAPETGGGAEDGPGAPEGGEATDRLTGSQPGARPSEAIPAEGFAPSGPDPPLQPDESRAFRTSPHPNGEIRT